MAVGDLVLTKGGMAGMLRDVYAPKMRRSFNLKVLLPQLFRRNTKNFKPGARIGIGLHINPGSGHTWSDIGELPEGSTEDVKRAWFTYKWMTDRITIRGDLVEDAGSGPPTAEEDPLEFQIESLIRTNRAGLAFDMYGDGSGKLCGVASASNGTTFVVDDVRGLRTNQRVDVLLTATGAVGAGGVRSAVITLNRGTKTCTLVSPSQLADGTGAELNTNAADYTVYRSKARNQAIFGLLAAIATGNPPVENYGGIDRTNDTYDAYRGVVHGNSGTPRVPTWKLFQDVMDDIESRSEAEPNIVVMPPELWSKFAAELSDRKRYTGQMGTLNGWAEAVRMGTLPFVKDRYCPATKAFVLDTRLWQVFQNNEGQWMDKDGSILHRLESRVAYSAAWHRRLQLICGVPAGQGVLEDLAYSV